MSAATGAGPFVECFLTVRRLPADILPDAPGRLLVSVRGGHFPFKWSRSPVRSLTLASHVLSTLQRGYLPGIGSAYCARGSALWGRWMIRRSR